MPGSPHTSNSANPTLCVAELTDVMFNRTLVTVRDENVNSVAPPAFTNDVTATAAPDENTTTHP